MFVHSAALRLVKMRGHESGHADSGPRSEVQYLADPEHSIRNGVTVWARSVGQE
jgi:hypothetical protein